MGGAGEDLISLNSAWYSTINGGTGNDTILSPLSRLNSINGGAGDDLISLSSSYHKEGSTIIGGTGDDTIYVDSLTSHLYQYNNGDGNDRIYGFKSDDTISLGGANYTRMTVGNDVVLGIGTGSITLSGASDKTINIKDGTLSGGDDTSSSGKNLTNITAYKSISGTAYADTIANAGSHVTITTGDGNDSILNSYSSTATASSSFIDAGNGNDTIINYTYGGDYTTVNDGAGNDIINNRGSWASISGGAGKDSILGNAGNDKLYGNAGNDTLYGGDGKDSLWGGAGNDMLWGGDGSDMFTYVANNGTDYVMDYESGELFRIYNAAGTKKTSFSKSAFNDDTLMLTINGGGTVILNDVDTSTNFNINGTSYKISGSKLVRK